MKSLVLLSLIAVAFAATQRPLSDIATSTAVSVTVTAQFPDAGTAPTVAAFTYTTTYNSATMASVFTVDGNGFYTGNNTVVAGTLTLTSGSDTVNVVFGTLSDGGNWTVNTFGGANSFYPRFLVTGSYSAALSLSTSASTRDYSVTLPASPAVAATAYVQPAAVLTLVSPQSGGCDATGCNDVLNGTLTITPATTGSFSPYFRSTGATSGVIYTARVSAQASGTTDLNDYTVDSISAWVGGWVNGFASPVPGASKASGVTLVPQNVPLAVSATFSENSNSAKYTRYAEGSTGMPASVTLSSGSTDVLPPTCSVVSVAPASITTIDNAVDTTITVTCQDETGGSGLWVKGVIINAAVTSGAGGSVAIASPAFTGATSTFPVPPYYTGSFSIVGVWAADNAGNAVLYGSCGGASGLDSLGCAGSGSGSGASQAVVSLFALAVVAIVALFA